MGEPNVTDTQMRRDLIASATADPTEFVDRVMENFNKLTSRISQADDRIRELTETAENQAALITDLSMRKDQAKREAEQMLSKARQEAAEIISDAKSQAKQLTNQAETKLINANVEADSIKTTKLNALRSEISTLESQRLTERDRTLGFLNKVAGEYDGIIEQYAQTLAQLRKAQAFISDQATEIESTNFEHFDIDQYLPHHSYQAQVPVSHASVDNGDLYMHDPIVAIPPMPAATQPDSAQQAPSVPQQPVQPVMQQPVAQQPVIQQPVIQQPVVPQQPVAQQPVMQQPVMQQPVMQQPVMQQPIAQPQPVAQSVQTDSRYVDDNGIMPTSRSFNEAFQMGGQPVAEDYEDDYEDSIDEFGDSGLLMEAMAGMDDGQDEEQDDFEALDPSDSGLLFDALSSIDDVDEQRDMEEFSEMDDFDEFEETLPPEPPVPPVRQRVKVPHRRRSAHPGNRSW